MVLWRDTTKLQRSVVKLVNSNKTNWDEFCLHIEQLSTSVSIWADVLSVSLCRHLLVVLPEFDRAIRHTTVQRQFFKGQNFRGSASYKIRGNKFRRSRIPVSQAQHYLLTVAATPCSAARFALLVELHLERSWFVRLSSSTTRLNLEPIDKPN